MKKVMRIVSHSEQWKKQFQREKQELLNIFGPLVIEVHHVGSTAITTTKAKPEIDILMVVREVTFLSRYDAAMQTLGYRVRGECLDQGGTPGRFYYSKDQSSVRTHKVHICRKGHPDIHKMLAFRDYLIAHPEVGQAYGTLKEELCEIHGYHDIQGYLKGKAAFIEDIVSRAMEES